MIDGIKNKDILTEEQQRLRNMELIGMELDENQVDKLKKYVEDKFDMVDLEEFIWEFELENGYDEKGSNELELNKIMDEIWGDELNGLKLENLEINDGIEYEIGYKNPCGKYGGMIKKFDGENHFKNWYNFMDGKGYKLITVNKL
jgi:hypothetical protein